MCALPIYCAMLFSSDSWASYSGPEDRSLWHGRWCPTSDERGMRSVCGAQGLSGPGRCLFLPYPGQFARSFQAALGIYLARETGRAPCRERVGQNVKIQVVAVKLKN